MTLQVAGTHHNTYDAIFRHPIARNLQWRDVRSLLASLAEVTDEPNGSVKVSRDGHSLVIHRPTRKDFSDVEQLMKLRRFLEDSGAVLPEWVEGEKHVLVVIDHRLARVYKTKFHGSIPQEIVPYNAGGAGRHLHYVQDESNGQRKPEVMSFYTAIAKTLMAAEKILIFGNGTGASSAMDQLLAELKAHHPELAARVIGSVAVDEHHLTDDQLLAQARAFYAANMR
jgi:hypothetical protein